MRSEHLGCHGLTDRTAKDHVCILQLLEKDAVDPSKLEKLLKEFNPADKWAQFESKYLERRK
jgi:hypothetical protein